MTPDEASDDQSNGRKQLSSDCEMVLPDILYICERGLCHFSGPHRNIPEKQQGRKIFPGVRMWSSLGRQTAQGEDYRGSQVASSKLEG